MQIEELKRLISEIKEFKAESQTIELKSAKDGCPTRLYSTLSSFSNQDEGGVLIFGINEEENYKITGVYDAQDLQKKITQQCKEMEPKVRALFTTCEIEGKIIVAAEIAGVEVAQRPVFYRGVGRLKGSFIRVGESNEPMSEYEIYSYEAFRKRIRDDLRTAPDSRLMMFDEDRVDAYLLAVRRDRRNLALHVNDEEIMELMGVSIEKIPTIAGLLTFSRYPQSYYPQLCITAVSLPGTEHGEVGDAGERFIDSKRITGAIPDMLEEAVEFVRKNSRTKTIIDDDGYRLDKPEYPIKAVREAILNALVHRDYSIHSENIPVRIEMYRDRLEITNSGGLYGSITLDALGKMRPETRNAALANMLELLKITENRYSGIPTMRRELLEAGLPLPIFVAKRGEFKVIMKNDYLTDDMSISEAIVEFCAIPRTRRELIDFTAMSRTYTMTKLVLPLVEKGLLQMTLPEKPKSSKQKFFKT